MADNLTIIAHNQESPGGACTQYDIGDASSGSTMPLCVIPFQSGPIPDVGINGVTNEALLAIVADRIKGFQSGPFGCRENALALTKIQEALHWLHHRTRERFIREVEGKMEA